MEEVITFDKSLQQRLMEYSDVFSRNEVLSVSQIKKEWSFFIEFSMDPIAWQAVWKIPRLTCEDLKISFPTIVLVLVEDVCPKTHSALIRVFAVQDEISIPEHHQVPLIQLWATKEQDPTVALDIQTTANSIDMLRFFYQNLMMPWDYEDDDNSDWLGKHLESRLRLYYDMKNGVIPRATAIHLHALLTDARRLQAKRERLEEILAEEGDTEVDISEISENKKLQTLMELHVKIVQIGDEVKLLENPLTRKVMIKKDEELAPVRVTSNVNVWLVAREGKIADAVTFLNDAKNIYPDETVSINSDLPTILDAIKPNDTIVLSKGKYPISTIGALECGGTLKSFYEVGETLLESNNEHIMMDISKGNVTFENLIFDASVSQCCLLVRKGKVTLKNCQMIGNGESSIHQGIIALAGSEVILENCTITKFATAIVGNTGSRISLNNCEIFNVNFGVKMFDKCIFNAVNSSFHNCEEYGLCIETEKWMSVGEQKVGNFDVLSIVPDISCDGINGENNYKGNVIISQKPKMEPVKDIFSQTLVNTMYPDTTVSDEEMEEVTGVENTVIEKKDD